MGLDEIEILHAQGFNQFSYIRFYLRLRNAANAWYWRLAATQINHRNQISKKYSGTEGLEEPSRNIFFRTPDETKTACQLPVFMNLNSIFLCRFQEERCQYIISCSAPGAHHMHTHTLIPFFTDGWIRNVRRLRNDTVIKITPLETMDHFGRCDVYKTTLFTQKQKNYQTLQVEPKPKFNIESKFLELNSHKFSDVLDNKWIVNTEFLLVIFVIKITRKLPNLTYSHHLSLIHNHYYHY